MNHQKTGNPTRGYGVLENWLAIQRGRIANQLIPDHLRQGKILDVGCGTLPLFLNTVSFKEKFGMDKVSCKPDYTETINFITHDFEKMPILPFESNSFEVVTSLAVIEHLAPETVLVLIREIRRILKSSGLFVLTTPAAWTEELLRIMAMVKLVSPVEIGEHKDLYTRKKLGSILYKTGFSKSGIQTGNFEFFANIWATAQK